jgi:hypothetical protein
MIFAALGALVLALLMFDRSALRVLIGRKGALLLSLAAAAGAVVAVLHGSWLGGSLLLSAALWLAAETRRSPKPPLSRMSPAEARATLGVSESAAAEEIEAAYRRLMLRVHPDVGGAPGLAARLNLARETLLRPRV